MLLTLAAVGITYGALITIMQKDLKRLVAYASIVDVAFIVLGFFAFSAQGVTGGVLEMVNHGLTTGAIFFLVGVIWERRGTLRFTDLGGLQRATPMLAAIFLAVVMSAVGLPGLNGFVGEFLVLVGTFITHRWWAVVATTAIISGAIYLLWAYQRVFWGPIRVESNAAVRDITWREIGAVAPLLAGIVFLGVYPRPVLDRITPSVNHLLAHVQHVDPQRPRAGARRAGGGLFGSGRPERRRKGPARAGGPCRVGQCGGGPCGSGRAGRRVRRWLARVGQGPGRPDLAAWVARVARAGSSRSIASGGLPVARAGQRRVHFGGAGRGPRAGQRPGPPDLVAGGSGGSGSQVRIGRAGGGRSPGGTHDRRHRGRRLAARPGPAGQRLQHRPGRRPDHERVHGGQQPPHPGRLPSILPILILSGGALLVLLIAAVLPKRSWPGLYPHAHRPHRRRSLVAARVAVVRRRGPSTPSSPSDSRSSTTDSVCSSCC